MARIGRHPELNTTIDPMRYSSIILLIGLFGFMACVPVEEPGHAIASLLPEDKVNIRHTIVRWLTCEECTDGELDAVIEKGIVVTPTLAAVLREGPSPAQREAARRALVRSYRELQEYNATVREYDPGRQDVSISMSEEAYVRMYLENYIALFRSRAAHALGVIGGPDAREALTQALNLEVREDVRTSIQEALASMES